MESENLIKADVVYGGWLTNHVGPSRSLTRFSKRPEFFIDHGVELNIYSFDRIKARNFSSSDLSLRSKLRARAIRFVVNMSRYSSFLTWWVIKNKYLVHGENIAKYYIDLDCQPDVVVFHELYSCYYYLKLRKNNTPKVVLLHHANGEAFKMLKIYHPRLEKSKYYKRLLEVERFTLSKIDKHVFISNNARKKFLNHNKNFPPTKTAFFHNGIEDRKEYRRKETLLSEGRKRSLNVIRLVCAGTINERKGQRILIEALSKVSSSKRELLHITFLGDGPQRLLLENLSKKLKVEKQVAFKGAVNDVEKYLIDSDAFILPSKDEGLPISIIEAMRAGLAIIGTNVAGVPEMIDHEKSGILLEPTVDAFVGVFENIGRYDFLNMGKVSRSLYLERFTLNLMMENYCNIIKSA